jgi:hypothetical protein
MRTRILTLATIAAVGGNVVAVAKPAPKPAKPQVATQAVQNLSDTSATLTGTVNPKGSQTSFKFEYGTTKTYGSNTGLVGAGAGNTNSPVTANLTGLKPSTTYHYRLDATNAAGTSMSPDKTFTTNAAGVPATGLTLGAAPNPVRYGATTTLSGRLTGPNAANQQVTLEQNPFPFQAGPGGFKKVGNAVVTDAQGNFTFPAVTLTVNTQFDATAGKNLTSPVVTVGNRVIVGMKRNHSRVRKGRKVKFSGTVTPAEDGALYAIQRRSNGKWLTVAGGALAHNATTPTTSTYSKSIHIRHGGLYRVFVKVTEGGHLSNKSASRRITLIR